MIIWTHRGFPGPENTIAAFRKAYLDGIRHFETDIHATSDGVLVLSHDPDLTRLINHEAEISTLTHATLNAISGNKHTWCTLEELIYEFKDVRISIDIKHEAALSPLIDLLKETNYQNLVVGSFSTNRIRKFIKALPDCTTALSPIEILKLKFNLYPRSLKGKKRYAMVPSKFGALKILTPRFIKNCAKLNIPIYIWTINSQEELSEIAHLGISGIVTDNYPAFATSKS